MIRLYAALAAIALLIGAGVYVVQLQKKADRVDAAELRADEAEKRALDIAETAAKAAAQDRKIAADLAAYREELGSQSLLFSQALTRKPLVVEVSRVDPQTGQSVTCRERDPVRYRCLHNQAVTGVADPNCVL